MRRTARVALPLALLATTACAHMPRWLGGDDPRGGVETFYWRAVAALDSTPRPQALDTAAYYLNQYVISSERQRHLREAMVLRKLVGDAQQFERVVASLQTQTARAESEARAETTKAASAETRRDDEALREIQRLKDELARANAELERIRKRLANPKEPER